MQSSSKQFNKTKRWKSQIAPYRDRWTSEGKLIKISRKIQTRAIRPGWR